jgi:hypothetical protein
MKVLICGSRGWTDRPTIEQAVMGVWASTEDEVTIIEGGAPGADSMARDAAIAFGMAVEEFPADWKTHGKRAGILRNLAMLDEKPDLVLAFCLHHSPGTTHTITEAVKRGIHTEVFRA